MKLLVAAGGTGGHVSPGIAVAKEWLARSENRQVVMAGGTRGVEGRMAARAGLPFESVAAWPLRRPLWDPRNLLLPPMLTAGVVSAMALLSRLQPAAVFATGAWVSVPYGLAAWFLRVPLVLHENDVAPGLANRLLAPLSRRVTLGMEAAAEVFGAKSEFTGNPSRLKPALPPRAGALKRFGLKGGRRTLLVMPGSGAALSVNRALIKALPRLAGVKTRLQLIWMSGQGPRHECQAAAERAGLAAAVQPFITDVASAYAAADLVLCRAGASTLAELALLGKPALLVPYPYATGDHQALNAQAAAAAGSAVVVADKALNGQVLASTLERLLKEKKLAAMAKAARRLGQKDSAKNIVDTLEAFLPSQGE